jgi:hypothetical protein
VVYGSSLQHTAAHCTAGSHTHIMA